MSRLRQQLLGLAAVLLLSACPPTVDDDDSAVEDTGSAPVITGVELCEIPALANCEAPDFGVRFAITATDEDDDMNNLGGRSSSRGTTRWTVFLGKPAQRRHAQSEYL